MRDETQVVAAPLPVVRSAVPDEKYPAAASVAADDDSDTEDDAAPAAPAPKGRFAPGQKVMASVKRGRGSSSASVPATVVKSYPNDRYVVKYTEPVDRNAMCSEKEMRFGLGQAVRAFWKGGKELYAAIVNAVNPDGTYGLAYYDKYTDPVCSAENIWAEDAQGPDGARFAVGQRVRAKWGSGDRWYGARVEKNNCNGTYAVLYDDGDRDANCSEAKISPANSPPAVPAAGAAAAAINPDPPAPAGGTSGAYGRSDALYPVAREGPTTAQLDAEACKGLWIGIAVTLFVCLVLALGFWDMLVHRRAAEISAEQNQLQHGVSTELRTVIDSLADDVADCRDRMQHPLVAAALAHINPNTNHSDGKAASYGLNGLRAATRIGLFTLPGSSSRSPAQLLLGGRLLPGEKLVTGRFEAAMQSDCNFVLYDLENNKRTARNATGPKLTSEQADECFTEFAYDLARHSVELRTCTTYSKLEQTSKNKLTRCVTVGGAQSLFDVPALPANFMRFVRVELADSGALQLVVAGDRAPKQNPFIRTLWR